MNLPQRIDPPKLLFYIGPWEFSAAINQGTVFQNISLILNNICVETIVLFLPVDDNTSSERVGQVIASLENNLNINTVKRVIFIRLKYAGLRPTLLKRFRCFVGNLKTLLFYEKIYSPGLIISRGANSSLALFVSRLINAPFVVESYEPHSRYMLQTATWKSWAPKYWAQRYIENSIEKSAFALITVSKGFSDFLTRVSGIDPDRIVLSICSFDQKKFFFDNILRRRARKDLGIEHKTVGIYVGKFSGTYYAPEVLGSLRHVRGATSSSVYLIILSDYDQKIIKENLLKAGFSDDDFLVKVVSHENVNYFLNAADFAISFINPGPWSFACSAIKHGEYWAAGLPVLMPPGIGDERDWLEEEIAGVFVNFRSKESVVFSFLRILEIIAKPGSRERISAIATRYRGFTHQERAYQLLLDKLRCR